MHPHRLAVIDFVREFAAQVRAGDAIGGTVGSTEIRRMVRADF
jgi:hypothetical protein